MTIPVSLENGGPDKHRLKIGENGEIAVVQRSSPSVDEVNESYPFSSYFQSSSGSSDMRVNGSSLSVDFSINSRFDVDIFVKSISIIIADANATLAKFGNLTALTNGIDFIYKSDATGEVFIQSAIKTNLDFIRLGSDTGAIGGGASAWVSDLSGGGADAYLPVINIQNKFGYPYGLHLRKGKLDKLSFRVNDDLSSGIDQFDIIGFGVQV